MRATLSSKASKEVLDQLARELQSHIKNFSTTKASRHQDLDTEGLSLWNLATRLMRSDGAAADTGPTDVFLAARVYAFLMLDSGNSHASMTPSNVVRLMKVALKAAKYSIGKHFAL